jgi:hypothetical protein
MITAKFHIAAMIQLRKDVKMNIYARDLFMPVR